MNAAQRREKILQQLHGASAPISASALAAKLGVSRQIVVGDVALLRAGGSWRRLTMMPFILSMPERPGNEKASTLL